MPEATKEATWDDIRAKINHYAKEEGEWAGAPMPIDHLRLSIEPRYPWQGLNNARLSFTEEFSEQHGDDLKIRNVWHDRRLGLSVIVYDDENGKTQHSFWPTQTAENRMEYQVHTLGVSASAAWSLDAEFMALEKFRDLVTVHAFKCYFLSGSFLETSPRSKVTYLFRKLRPTIAMRPKNGRMHPIAALCMHPIGFYQQSYAGVMVPTDDVIAQLTWMRGDERRYWAMTNHHKIGTAEAGV